MRRLLFLILIFLNAANAEVKNILKLPQCGIPDFSSNVDFGSAGRTKNWDKCWGNYKSIDRNLILEGEWRDGYLDGKGTMISISEGFKYEGEFRTGQRTARGEYFFGKNYTIISSRRDYAYEDGVLEKERINVNSERERLEQEMQQKLAKERQRLEEENRQQLAKETRRLEEEKIQQEQKIAKDRESQRQQLAEERRKFEEEKRKREQQRRNERINLQVQHTQPAPDGSLTINIQTNADTASLLINGEEQGGRANGDYLVKKVARAGQETKFTIVATDINGNTDSKIITVSRAVVDSKVIYASLNPAQVKRQTDLDAVAIIIGITDYKSLPKAEFANDDARVFYDYAIRALGVKPENIKLLVDHDAEEVEIIKAFKTWLPSRVKSTTDVYVFYSGHGLPTQDGQGLYLLPLRADRDFISRTAIQFQEINADLQAAKPKSVTIFMDSCYSGRARSGETLVANARPVTLKAEKKLFPDNFTVITASQADQISSSSSDLKHGIFSYYLMKGMEGDADANKDGKITLGEMQAYLVENVGRQAGMVDRKQEPQLIGDVGRVLVGK